MRRRERKERRAFRQKRKSRVKSCLFLQYLSFKLFTRQKFCDIIILGREGIAFPFLSNTITEKNIF
jgi:hypothetical protein